MRAKKPASPLKTMVLAVAALLCLTLFQNCEHTSPHQTIGATSRIQGHVIVPSPSVVVTSAKTAHYLNQ